jgi:exopolysaccharide biosynthesis polyprenyl glycosylphosphotransferase
LATGSVLNDWDIPSPTITTRQHPSLKGQKAIIKRSIDILGSLAGLFFLSPLFLLAAIAIRLESKGPILFKQTRIGLHGRKFTMFKFRSMYLDAESQFEHIKHLNEVKDGPIFKIKEDPRITRVGKFLRRTSIDELPQFINVLREDMSLVGPRPPLPREVASYAPAQWLRLSVRPGLSGLWQVNGRSELASFEEMFLLDRAYIERWSLWMDIRIILKTVKVVLSRHGSC